MSSFLRTWLLLVDVPCFPPVVFIFGWRTGLEGIILAGLGVKCGLAIKAKPCTTGRHGNHLLSDLHIDPAGTRLLCKCRLAETKYQAGRKSRENNMTQHDCPPTSLQGNDAARLTGSTAYPRWEKPAHGGLRKARAIHSAGDQCHFCNRLP